MDDIDAAQEHIERELEQRIAFARNKPEPPKSTHCLNCGEPVDGRRFCSTDCAEDHEYRARHNKRLGVR